MDQASNITVHTIVYWSQADQLWLARCLEFDLLGHGSSQDEAARCLDEAIRLHVENALEHGFNLFRRAPDEYWELFFRAAARRLRAKPSSLQTEPVTAAVAV